jgi:hypothetical protein
MSMRLSPIRESILSLLAQKGHPLSPSEIATALDPANDVVRKKLSLMKKDGQVLSETYGLYQLKLPDPEPVRDVFDL